MLVGVIADTHGTLHPGVHEEFRGVEHILHAGDIGPPDILPELRAIAPVTAVRGNHDKPEWAEDLAETEVVVFGEVYLYLLHDLKAIDLDPQKAGCSAVISGHTHVPSITCRDGILFINPGAAGAETGHACSVALLTVDGATLSAELRELGRD